MDWINDEKIRLVILFGGMFILYGVEFLLPPRKAERQHLASNVLLTVSLIFVNLLCSGALVYLALWADSNNFDEKKKLSFIELIKLPFRKKQWFKK